MTTPITLTTAPTTARVPRINVAAKAGAPLVAVPAGDAFVASTRAAAQPAALPARSVSERQAIQAMGLAGGGVAALIGAQYVPGLLALVGLTGPVGIVLATVLACAGALAAFKGAATLQRWYNEHEAVRPPVMRM